MLGMFPQDLDSIELGAIGRQIVQIQTMFRPLAPLLLYRIALVYACIVDDDDSWNFMRPNRDLIEERDHILAYRLPLLSGPDQHAIMA